MCAFRRCLLRRGCRPNQVVTWTVWLKPYPDTNLALVARSPVFGHRKTVNFVGCDIRHNEIQFEECRDSYQGTPLRRADNPGKKSRL